MCVCSSFVSDGRRKKKSEREPDVGERVREREREILMGKIEKMREVE